MKWVGEHIGEAIAILALFISNVIAFARIIFQHNVHGERLKAVEKELSDHTDSRDLHRNPDFDRRIDSIFGELREIKGMLAQVLRLKV
jgi:hypothetical protein